MPSDRLSKRPAHRCANLQPWRVRRPGARIAGSGGCEVHDRCEFDRDYQNFIKAALPGMKNRGDRGPASIAMISSQAGQEVIGDNIHVSLIFPPETDTPGQSQDLKTRPELCNIIVASSSPMKPDEVAAVTLNGIKSGTFSVACNFDGVMLSVATAGFSPQRSYLVAFLEVVTAGFMRIMGLYYQWSWYRTIERWHLQKNSVEL
ncbi:hypothetical protein MRB53_029222 [Persea americana]|uniref:Uncharacterized protein n=1 Tax=Persea americana TaxID=3435 RepID=A0ACC2KI11_PERAE|nr:hypothetical protein MRB53_029222 [Persea americana]